MCVEQSRVAILNQNEMVNEPCASVLMRIYNLDIAPAGALFERRGWVTEVNSQRRRM